MRESIQQGHQREHKNGEHMAVIDAAAVMDQLKVTHVVTSKTGTHINVDEKFKAAFTITNTSPALSFGNVRLEVAKTPFATPVKEQTLSLELPDIAPGSSESTDAIEFMALGELDKSADETTTGKPQFVHEAFANLTLRANPRITPSTLSRQVTRTVDIR